VAQDTSVPTPPAAVGDYTPFVTRLLSGNGGKAPDLIEMVTSVGDTAGLNKKLQALGYKGIVLGFTLYDPRLAAAAKGSSSLVQFEPYESRTPATQQMVADLHAVNPTVALSQTAAAGYWSADLFVALLQKVGRNLSRESLVAAANSGFHYGVDGGTPPVDYPAYHSIIAPCAAFVEGNGTGFDVKVPLSCADVIPNPLKS